MPLPTFPPSRHNRSSAAWESRLGPWASQRYGLHMSTQYIVEPEKVRIGAGTALKFGFFAAFGVFLFYLILSVILGTVAFFLAASGTINVNWLPGL
jgi:type III secretory pathway component EscV